MRTGGGDAQGDGLHVRGCVLVVQVVHLQLPSFPRESHALFSLFKHQAASTSRGWRQRKRTL